MRKVMMVLLVVGICTVSVQAAVIDEDFEGLTVGSYSSADTNDSPADVGASSWAGYGQTQADIVDSGSTPADPFGGAGNQSMVLVGTAAGANPVVQYDGDAITGSARFKLDFNNSAGDIYIEIKDSVGTKAISIYAYSTGVIGMLGVSNFEETYNMDTNYCLLIDFDVVADTYTATLNGTDLTRKIGEVVHTTHSFRNATADISDVWLENYLAGGGSEAFFDDLSVIIPEPVTLGLLAVGGLMALIRRRRG